jgi:hypothetical protein
MLGMAGDGDQRRPHVPMSLLLWELLHDFTTNSKPDSRRARLGKNPLPQTNLGRTGKKLMSDYL